MTVDGLIAELHRLKQIGVSGDALVVVSHPRTGHDDEPYPWKRAEEVAEVEALRFDPEDPQFCSCENGSGGPFYAAVSIW